MGRYRILVTWIGQADYRAMALGLPSAEREKVLAQLKPGPAPRDGTGPIRTLLERESFDEVHLLSNDPPDLARRFEA